MNYCYLEFFSVKKNIYFDKSSAPTLQHYSFGYLQHLLPYRLGKLTVSGRFAQKSSGEELHRFEFIGRPLVDKVERIFC